MKKILLVSALALSSTLSFAQKTNEKSMEVSATANGGCNVSGEFFMFPNIAHKSLVAGEEISLTRDLKVQCSKGTTVKLTQVGNAIIHPTRRFESLNILAKQMGGIVGVNKSIVYNIMVDNLTTNNDYTLVSKPANNILLANRNDLSESFVELTIKTSQEINLPIKLKLNEQISKKG